MDKVEITDSAFSPWESLALFEAESIDNLHENGAHANFIGRMRTFNEGDDVAAMRLEHYPEMTKRQLDSLIRQAGEQWPISHSLVIHRVGDIAPGDAIVLVATWSAHRKAAFESCRFLMEELKSTVPFWKKETLVDGSERWVEKNTPGY